MARDEIDPDLITAAREGCRDAFSGIVKATYDDTYSLALRLTGNPADAEDVAQDTYLRVFKHLRRFRGEAQLGTWLHRITVNCASNLTAKRRRVQWHEESAPDAGASTAAIDPAGDPAERAAAGDLRARIEAAVEALPAKLRSVVVLRDVAGMTHDAIARELGISESAAKVRLHRARLRLREQVFDGEAAPVPSRPRPSPAEGATVASDPAVGAGPAGVGQVEASQRRVGVA